VPVTAAIAKADSHKLMQLCAVAVRSAMPDRPAI